MREKVQSNHHILKHILEYVMNMQTHEQKLGAWKRVDYSYRNVFSLDDNR